MANPKSQRKAVLRSSRSYYGRRARYDDLIAQRRNDERTPSELDFLEYAFKTHASRSVKQVLDVACGGGRHAVGLAQRGYQCTGQDFTPERVEMARARAQRAGVTVKLKQGDATQLAYDNEFDAVLALYILFLLPSDDDVQQCLGNIRKALRPGGIVVGNLYNPFSTGKNWLVKLIRDGQNVSETVARGIRETEIQKLERFDPILGAGWVHETSIIEASHRSHVFCDREHFRLLTYWDLARYLRDAGFKEIHCYPDWKVRPARKPKAEQLVLVARK